MLQRANSKLARVQTVKSKPFTLYDEAREWTTMSKFHQTIPIMKTKKKRMSQQRKMIKVLLTIKQNPLCPKPHFLNIFKPIRRKIIVKKFESFQKYPNIHSFLGCNQLDSFLRQVIKEPHRCQEQNLCSSWSDIRYTSILSHSENIAPKYKDPGSPTISIWIGDQVMDRCLLDLGASVNLLPYSVYKKLGLGKLQPID